MTIEQRQTYTSVQMGGWTAVWKNAEMAGWGRTDRSVCARFVRELRTCSPYLSVYQPFYRIGWHRTKVDPKPSLRDRCRQRKDCTTGRLLLLLPFQHRQTALGGWSLEVRSTWARSVAQRNVRTDSVFLPRKCWLIHVQTLDVHALRTPRCGVWMSLRTHDSGMTIACRRSSHIVSWTSDQRSRLHHNRP